VLTWTQSAWAWLRRWSLALFAGALVLLGAGWLWRRKAVQLGRALDEAAVARARRDIARLQGLREEVAARVGEKDDAISVIDEKLAENRRVLVEAHEGGQGLTDGEVADAFRRLGY
jgi:cation transport ATPase